MCEFNLISEEQKKTYLSNREREFRINCKRFDINQMGFRSTYRTFYAQKTHQQISLVCDYNVMTQIMSKLNQSAERCNKVEIELGH